MQKTFISGVLLLALCLIMLVSPGCNSSSDSSGAWNWDGGSQTSSLKIQTVTNLNNPGEALRQGDWCQIDGTGFGSSQGSSYTRFTLENGATGNADLYNSWSETQIVCRVPLTVESRYVARVTWGVQVFLGSGIASSSTAIEGNPTPNPTPTNSAPSPTPSPTASPSASPTPSPTYSPSPSPSPESGGGGGGGGNGGSATETWYDLGLVPSSTGWDNIQVGADVNGNIYVSGEQGGTIYVYESEAGVKTFRNMNSTITPIATFPGASHSLHVPTSTSQTFGLSYWNDNNVNCTVGKKIGSSYSISNCIITTGITPAEKYGTSLHLNNTTSGFVAYNYYSSGNKFSIQTTNMTSSSPLETNYSGRNCTVASNGTTLSRGYIDGSSYYSVSSWNGSTWLMPTTVAKSSNGKIFPSTSAPNVVTNVTSSGDYQGLNLYKYQQSGNSYYYIPQGNPALNGSATAFGKPYTYNGATTLSFLSGKNVVVSRNSGASSSWSSLGSCETDGTSTSFGSAMTSTGGTVIAVRQSGGVRIYNLSSTAPKMAARNSLHRTMSLCSIMGIALPMPKR